MNFVKYKQCFTYSTYVSSQICCYGTVGEQSVSGGLLTDPPYGGSVRLLHQSPISDEDAYDKCCVQSKQFCNKFYQLRPSNKFVNYKPMITGEILFKSYIFL